MPMREDYLNRTRMTRALVLGLDDFDEEARELSRRDVTGPEGFLALELEAEALGRRLKDAVTRAAIMRAHLSRESSKQAARDTRRRYREAGELARIDNMGPRGVGILLPGGGSVRLYTPYLRPSRKGLVGRPRVKRGEGGSGRYPVLEQLGIEDGVTPLTRSKISRMVVLCSSYAEAQDQLREQGLKLEVSTIVRVAVATGTRALGRRDEALKRAREQPLPEKSMVAGQRIRVSVDGGRARTRSTHSGSRKGKNGRRSFDLQWREPRIITIDVLNEKGVIDRNVPPIYEVALDHADEVFAKLAGLLRLIGANQAAQVVFVADGADWIWDRIDALIVTAEILADRVHKILDFYHASEHISDALKACKNLSKSERKALHAELAGVLLEPDGHATVIARLSTLARGRRAAAVNKEIKYLRKHEAHMQYAEWRAAEIPIGSGIVESAVRRVINQRFKAASLCWREDHLYGLLYLRCILKAGRWNQFVGAQLRREHWLAGGSLSPGDVANEAA